MSGGTFTNKVKGFTLIELLAVIIILAVLALILVPTITNIIETSRKESFKDSAYGLVETAKLYYSTKMTANMGSFTTTTFTVQNGTMAASNGDTLDFNGQTPVGDSWIKINDEGNVSMLITNGKYYASKDADEVAVAVTETEDGALTREELTTKVNELTTEVESLKSSSNTNTTNINNLSTVTANNISDLKTSDTTLQSNIDSLSSLHSSDIASLQSSINTINSNLTTVNNNLSDLSSWKLKHIGTGVNSGENERAPYFDFTGQSDGVYIVFCFDVNTQNSHAVMTLVTKNGGSTISYLQSYSQNTVFNEFWSSNGSILYGKSISWYAVLDVFKLSF